MPSYHIFSATTAQVPYLYQNFIIPYFPAKEVKPLKNILRMMDTKLYRGAKASGVTSTQMAGIWNNLFLLTFQYKKSFQR